MKVSEKIRSIITDAEWRFADQLIDHNQDLISVGFYYQTDEGDDGWWYAELYKPSSRQLQMQGETFEDDDDGPSLAEHEVRFTTKSSSLMGALNDLHDQVLTEEW